MPIFEYKAIDETGSEVNEAIEAQDAGRVAEQLDKMGYFPIRIREKGASGDIEIFSTKKKVKQDDLIVFTKQLVTLLKAGVPLLSALEALVEQADNETLKEIVKRVYVDIESGLSFSEALGKHPKIFSDLYVNSIKAGEMGGALDEVLERLAELLDHEQVTKARIKSAVRYPIIVVVSLVLAFTALMLLVVPKFIDLFSKLGVDLPLPTRVLIGFYTALTTYWYFVVGALLILAIAFYKYIRTEKGAYQWDMFMIKVPILGPLTLKTAMSRFTRMFETLNSSGLPILQTLEISSKTVGNQVVGKEIERATIGILQGQGIAGPLSQGKIFPPMVIKMISIGEQSGSLDDMLMNVSRHYDTEVDYAVKNLTSMIEPILTVGVGVIVLFLALAIFMPMWDLTKLAQ
ncbi:MAG TPA: type II secretion system F family protein [bacterium]